MASEFNDKIKAGYTYTFIVLDMGPDKVTSTDLTGVDAVLELKRQSDPTEVPALRLTSNPPAGLTITALEGKTVVVLSATQTAALKDGMFDYHLANFFPGGVVVPVLTGVFTIEPQLIALP